jgi:hypothetical protein
MEIGTRVKIVQDIDVYPTAYISAGETGTIALIEDNAWYVTLDVHHPELNEWNNEIEIWDWSNTLPNEPHPEWHPSAYVEPIE